MGRSVNVHDHQIRLSIITGEIYPDDSLQPYTWGWCCLHTLCIYTLYHHHYYCLFLGLNPQKDPEMLQLNYSWTVVPVWIHIKPITILIYRFGIISNQYRYICLAPYQTNSDNRSKLILSPIRASVFEK